MLTDIDRLCNLYDVTVQRAAEMYADLCTQVAISMVDGSGIDDTELYKIAKSYTNVEERCFLSLIIGRLTERELISRKSGKESLFSASSALYLKTGRNAQETYEFIRENLEDIGFENEK